MKSSEHSIKNIVKDYLAKHGFQGLTECGGECACELSDLMHCDYPTSDCIAGYKIPCDCGEGCGFHITEQKP